MNTHTITAQPASLGMSGGFQHLASSTVGLILPFIDSGFLPIKAAYGAGHSLAFPHH